MAMKQTQTKMFDFADVGLDFCSGSKNLFPDRFKKMLSQGYNEQTVASVSVTGNQVTLNYGVTHGYAADRVMKINSGPLAAINGGEFWIDAVTATSLTMTIDNAPVSMAGGFVTKIASLGWGLVYEQAHIQIYKFKHIDDTDMYARFCFQNATASGNRNCVAVGIGRAVDLNLGHITDPNCLQDLATCATVAGATSNIRWDFSSSTANTFNGYTYSQGYSIFGRAMAVGSAYHLGLMYSQATSASYQHFAAVSAIMPFYSSYDVINYPLLIAQNNGASTTTTSGQLDAMLAYASSNRVTLSRSTAKLLDINIATSSFLPAAIDSFNTTTCQPVAVLSYDERQFVGYVIGMYEVLYNASNSPVANKDNFPSLSLEVDFNHYVLCHFIRQTNSSAVAGSAWLAFPVEEIKFGT